MIRKYHSHKLQTNPWHRDKEPNNNHETPRRQTKQGKHLSLPHQDCKTRCTQSNAQPKIDHLQNPLILRINNNRTTSLERTTAKPLGWGGGGLNSFYWYSKPWADPEGSRGLDLPPGKSQVAIGFLRNSGRDRPWVQLLLEGGPYGPLWNTLTT